MHIAFIGDAHGRVYHLLAALLRLQDGLGGALDCVIQVGDLGAFPDPDRLDEATKRYAQLDPSELHISHLLGAPGALADGLRAARRRLARPVHFIRGNHDDIPWLDAQRRRGRGRVVAIDPFDLLRLVPDGAVLELASLHVAFLGGCEYGAEDATRIDPEALDALYRRPPRSVDLLVTHDGPYGIATNYLGATQGSRMLTDLVAHLEPAYHVAGHYHHMIGPQHLGNTTYLGLASLFPGRRSGPPLQDGSLALLDTSRGELGFVTDGWLRDFGAGFAFEEYFAALAAG